MYVVKRYLALNKLPLELAEQLSSHCGITDPEGRRLAIMVVTLQNIQDIQEELVSRGYHENKGVVSPLSDQSAKQAENTPPTSGPAPQVSLDSAPVEPASEKMKKSTLDDENNHTVHEKTHQNINQPRNQANTRETMSTGAGAIDVSEDHHLSTMQSNHASQSVHPPADSIPSKLLMFARTDPAKDKVTYQGGLDEAAILSLYRQVTHTKPSSHKPVLIEPPDFTTGLFATASPFIVDHGLPDRSWREFTRNLTSRVTRKELAQVVYLSNAANNAQVDKVDDFSLDKSIRTLPGRVHVDGSLALSTTVFVSLPTPIEQQEAFAGELFVSSTRGHRCPQH